MATLLSDYNCEKHARHIFYCLERLQYLDWLTIELVFFNDVGIPINATDEIVWQFCQETGYYLLTGNRSRKDKTASLHDVLERLAGNKSRPVITVGNLRSVILDKRYCQACAEAIAEIALNEALYIGIPRLYIP